MKKLMIAAAIVCATAMAHAVQFNWGSTSYDYTDHEGGELSYGTAFLYLGEVTATDSAFVIGTAKLLDIGYFNDSQYAWGKPTTSELQSNPLVTKTSGDAFSIVFVEGDVDTLDGYEGYYTILNGSSEEATILGETPIKYASFVDSTTPISTTSYMSVPEPTSGLLLLLGVAGLALRRRRA